MIKIVHIITGLNSGGAENMLYKLLKYSDKTSYNHEVVSLMGGGIYGGKISNLGVKVHCLNISKTTFLSSLIKTKKICKDADIIDTWLYHADIVGFIVAKIILRKKLIWNIRHSNLNKDANKSTTLKIIKFNSFLSRYVDCITYNSNEALKNHLKIGYSNKNSKVIPNGFELDKFKFNPEARAIIRQEFGFKDSTKVIITVGRWNIQKDYYTLLKAISELKELKIEFKLIMVGTNLDHKNHELVNLIKTLNLEDKIILLGRRDDIPELLSAADVYISSSLGESFSNAIGEAMACELPCIVTDVGDSKSIVGDTGKVVAAKDYKNMCNELFNFLNNNHSLFRNNNGRQRVIANYDIKQISKIFEKNFKEVVDECYFESR
ncbi:glycosyltransferase [Tepidanaerobacter sp. EBM-49]|uniref:glycosyltransferase n=1 Tax=Tepidanaerobacter sp. EBM-49 TaxID=1918504 RepID=UPI000A3F2F7B|nr:glycosyltransferase [Tepidanaerobacter sp. EBM-49]